MTQGSALTDYIKRGWFIFPIKRGMKFPPLIADNLAGASNSAKRVASWAKIYPGCNWGLSLAKSNMLVVDVDRADGKIGQDTFDHLDLLNGWPDTYTVRSPSGGEHRYYQITEGHKHIFALGKAGFGSGIDSPNYVLLAGCTLANGSYAVINDAPLAPTPEWFWQVLDEAKRGRERVAQEPVVELDQDANINWAIHYLTHDAPASIQGEGGEATTLRVAAVLKDNGISLETCLELMASYYNRIPTQAGEPGCDPVWLVSEGATADRLDVKVANAYAYLKQQAPGSRTAEADFAGKPLPSDAEMAALVKWWAVHDAAWRKARQTTEIDGEVFPCVQTPSRKRRRKVP